jgi:hypothetical protein
LHHRSKALRLGHCGSHRAFGLATRHVCTSLGFHCLLAIGYRLVTLLLELIEVPYAPASAPRHHGMSHHR